MLRPRDDSVHTILKRLSIPVPSRPPICYTLRYSRWVVGMHLYTLVWDPPLNQRRRAAKLSVQCVDDYTIVSKGWVVLPEIDMQNLWFPFGQMLVSMKGLQTLSKSARKSFLFLALLCESKLPVSHFLITSNQNMASMKKQTPVSVILKKWDMTGVKWLLDSRMLN